MTACSKNGNLELCKRLITEVDIARKNTKEVLNSFGASNPTKPLPAFVNYYDIPWSNNPNIHFWVGTIDLSAFGLSASAQIAVNNVTGDIFLGYGGGATTAISKPSAGASLSFGSIMSDLSNTEKAKLGETINNTLEGNSLGGNVCGYFVCTGGSKTPDTIENGDIKPGKVLIQWGIGTGVSSSESLQQSNMVPIGKILK